VHTVASYLQRKGGRRDRTKQTTMDISKGTNGNGRRQGLHHRKNLANIRKHRLYKGRGEHDIKSKILMWTFKRFPGLMTLLYIGYLRKGCVHKIWKSARIIPLTKPGKENCKDTFKYRPIRILNVGSKVIEKLLINR